MTDPRRMVLLAALRITVRGGLAGVWVRGHIPPGPVVWAANHHSWWDPLVAADLLTRARREPLLLADPATVRRYRFARRLGVIGTGEIRAGLAGLRRGGVLVLYPEGRLLPPGPPARLTPGAAWFAQRAPARLCSVAVRVLLRGGQYPEAYLVFREVAQEGDLAAVTRRLHAQLAADLTGLDQLAAGSAARAPLPGMVPVTRTRRSWDERVDAMTGWLPWRAR